MHLKEIRGLGHVDAAEVGDLLAWRPLGAVGTDLGEQLRAGHVGAAAGDQRLDPMAPMAGAPPTGELDDLDLAGPLAEGDSAGHGAYAVF